MLVIGDYNTLKVAKMTAKGCFFHEEEREIWLPFSETPSGTHPGDELKVFVYNRDRERLQATTRTPKAVLGEFAALRVKIVTSFGAFMDWGIYKDLFVPQRHLAEPLNPGDLAVVYLLPDFDSTGVIGTTKLQSYFEKDGSGLEENQEVLLLGYERTKLGVKVVIENRYSGMVYHNEIFESFGVGDRRTGYIKKIREDGLIDAALQAQGFVAASADAREVILTALREAKGFLPLHDRSRPEEIKAALGLSKKIFKKSIGGLYREKMVSLEESGIRLISK